MIKVHILTFFNAMNYGTFLQAYALQKTVEKFADVMIINYYENNQKQSTMYLKGIIKNIFRPKLVISKYIKNKKMISLRNKLKLTTEINDNNLKNFIFDCVIIGSDEVWNLNNSNVKNHLLFFGNNLASKKLYSYAASCGSATTLSEEAIQLLSRFNLISVRDQNTQNILNNHGYLVDRHIDPTFLYDFVFEVVYPKIKDYILFYGETVENQSIIEEIIDYARYKNKKIICVGPYQKWNNYNINNASPFEFIGYINNAYEVITNTFHGLILSIKYNKPVHAIVLEHKKNKIYDVFSMFNHNFDFKLRYDKNEIDWDNINRIIIREREKSINYIKFISLQNSNSVR